MNRLRLWLTLPIRPKIGLSVIDASDGCYCLSESFHRAKKPENLRFLTREKMPRERYRTANLGGIPIQPDKCFSLTAFPAYLPQLVAAYPPTDLAFGLAKIWFKSVDDLAYVLSQVLKGIEDYRSVVEDNIEGNLNHHKAWAA